MMKISVKQRKIMKEELSRQVMQIGVLWSPRQAGKSEQLMLPLQIGDWKSVSV